MIDYSKMAKNTDLKEEIQLLLRDCPDALDLLPPFHKAVCQALMGENRGTTTAGKVARPSPPVAGI